MSRFPLIGDGINEELEFAASLKKGGKEGGIEDGNSVSVRKKLVDTGLVRRSSSGDLRLLNILNRFTATASSSSSYGNHIVLPT